MATASAPAKVYLFGEHAVVYGEPAIPCAIQLRANVTAERRPGGLRVHAPDLSLDGFAVEYDDGAVGNAEQTPAVEVPDGLAERATRYVSAALAQARAAAREAGALSEDESAGFEITVESDIPLGAGLGSSAAVVVATLAAATSELGVDLSGAAVADRAYRVERAVQGTASRADTFCSTMGGAVRVEGEDCQRLDAPRLPFVVGYDGGGGDTADLVATVREFRAEYDFAADTVAAIGDLVRRGEQALAAGNREELGRLMNSNHGLLSALGVSARSLDAMVWAAREAGADGAKLTGAGGGGCVVALDKTAASRDALAYTPACEDAFLTELDTDGVQWENR